MRFSFSIEREDGMSTFLPKVVEMAVILLSWDGIPHCTVQNLGVVDDADVR